jgi:putative transposase
MTQQHQQNHATWECKYHVVFIPKYRKKAIFGVIKKRLGDVFHELARRRESKIEEGHLMPDHVHMLISIPPKYSVAEVVGFMKGKSSIWIAQNVERKARNSPGTSFGLAATSSRRSGGTRRRSEPTSRTKRCRIANWISSQ